MPRRRQSILVAMGLVLMASEVGMTEEVNAMELRSAAFQPGQPIPARYTCDGQDMSPPLAWAAAPASTQSLALIADDPDAPVGTWVHWVVWNIPANARTLEENIPKTASPPSGARQGTTDFGRVGYGGPCPPTGTHRYRFTLYALPQKLDIPPGTDKKNLQAAMEGAILDQYTLVGLYKKTG